MFSTVLQYNKFNVPFQELFQISYEIYSFIINTDKFNNQVILSKIVLHIDEVVHKMEMVVLVVLHMSCFVQLMLEQYWRFGMGLYAA